MAQINVEQINVKQINVKQINVKQIDVMLKDAVPVNEAQLWQWVGDIPDPEIPVLTLGDLGIIRHIKAKAGVVHIGVSPTYSGCPATEVIAASVIATLQAQGVTNAQVDPVLAPPWSSDWITDAGRQKLRDYGIAPPTHSASSKRSLLDAELQVECPRCASDDTLKVSEFGSTPCKASYKCRQCLEPFELFKCI